MNGGIDPLGVLFMIAWLTVGGFAVNAFVGRRQRTILHWLSLVIGVVMLALPALGFAITVWAMLFMRR